MAFSGALTLTDLNDYLGPSQACIKPVSGKDAPSAQDDAANKDIAGGAATEIAIDADGEYYESSMQKVQSKTISNDDDNYNNYNNNNDKPRERTRLETAEISLNDCLACSGCVTSAETVLIGMQSVDELRKVVEQKQSLAIDAPTHLVASIAPQSLASLSARYSSSLAQPIPLSVILDRIRYFLMTKMKFDIVIDTSFARHIALSEQAQEFSERRKSSQHGSQPSLPMLASACPGWICYAEKTHGELLPLISQTRSPQQIAGVMAKKYLVHTTNDKQDETAPKRTYHMTVMPCYDKKLEASRQDFFDDVTKTRDVDLVITTGELDGLMQSESFDICQNLGEEQGQNEHVTTPPLSDSGAQEDMIGLSNNANSIPSLLNEPGSSSGSFLFDLIKRVWVGHVEKVGQNAALAMPLLTVKTIRSADYTEYVLRSSVDDGRRILFKGAQCYGFRNLQNLVRKVQRQTGLKSKKSGAGALIDGPSTLINGVQGRRGKAALRGRGGGMVRRGRGALSAGVAGRTMESSPLSGQVDADDDQRLANVREDEEARGYDFVEVMACPGGCVNGGGQIRPPGHENNKSGESSSLTTRTISAEMTEARIDDSGPLKDPEGYISGWSTPPMSVSSENGSTALLNDLQAGLSSSSSPMDLDSTATAEEEAAVQGWKGTTKEWVRRVEYIYWRAAGLRTHAEKQGDDADLIGSVHQAQTLGITRDNVQHVIAQSIATLAAKVQLQHESSSSYEKLRSLDNFADLVVASMCQSASRARDGANIQRSDLLRTGYRALQDEAVSGLAVQW